MMSPMAKKFLLASFVTVCLLPVIQPLTIPPEHNDATQHGSTEPSVEVDAGSLPGTKKTEKLDDSSESSETNEANLKETIVRNMKPIFEVVDVVLRPFRPPSILVMDFFSKSNGTSDELDSTENNGTSSNGETSRNDKITGDSSTKIESTNGLSPMKPSFAFDSANNLQGENNDDTNEDSSTPLPTTLTSSKATKKDGSNDNNDERRKRETHQIGNNSNKDDDNVPSSSGNGDISSSKHRNVQPEEDMDMTTTPMTSKSDHDGSWNNDTSNHADLSISEDDDDDDNDTNNNEKRKKPETKKSGTVKIFLEILQLVPLTNSTTSDDENDSGTTTTITPEAAEDATQDPISAPAIPSSVKDNSNQKFPFADSRVTTSPIERKEVPIHKRAVRSLTTATPLSTKATTAAENQSNPSKSPTASASPSSGKTSKPLTSNAAPAAPAPSTTRAVKVSTSSANAEGPPLENVTEPLGPSQD